MYRIVILTGQESQKSFFTERIFKFCAGRGLFPRIEQYCDQESFFEAARTATPENAVIALPGVDGMNAAEHLRALCPTCKIIWCSDLDFSLHAFRLRIDYFLLEPVTEENFCQGLCAWFERKIPVTRSSDCNEHNKEDHS